MPDLLVRDIRPETLEALEDRARRRNSSVQAQVTSILDAETERERRILEFRAVAMAWHKRLAGRTFSDSTNSIREDRDSDHGRDPDYGPYPREAPMSEQQRSE